MIQASSALRVPAIPRPFASAGAMVFAAGLLAACGTSPLEPDSAAPVETRAAGAGAGGAGAGTASPSGVTPQSQVTTVDLSRDAGASSVAGVNAGGAAGAGGAALLSASSARVVYFDYDSFAIREDFKPMLEAHARALAAQRGRHLVVEGHTDERGGREYNLALGQKRAQAVVHSLVLLGATEGQLEAVSFGKERPAVQGSDEAAWAKNRRAELKDR